MKKLFTLVIMIVSVSLSANVYAKHIFENVAEGNGWGDGILETIQLM